MLDPVDGKSHLKLGDLFKVLLRKRSPAQRPQCDDKRDKTAVLAIMKNEALNVREWVDHYRWQGIDRIFLIDNGSTDGGPGLIEKEIREGYVELFSLPEPHKQWAHYQKAIVEGRILERVEWLVMADLDEFWFAPESLLGAAIDGLEDVDLVYANWKMFGACGYQSHPPSLRRCLTLRHPVLSEHRDTKWICRTAAIKHRRDISVHKVSGIDSARVVSDNVRFHLNHYPLQSMEYFTKVKMTRGDVSSGTFDAVRTLDYFDRHDSPATLEDRLLADAVP